jgi:hypothetical protein
MKSVRPGRHVILSETASFDDETGDLRGVVETP